MCAALCDDALAQNDNDVASLNGGQAVGNDNSSALPRVCGNHLVDALLRQNVCHAVDMTATRTLRKQALACTIFSLALSRALVASSKRLMVALRSSMRAMATRCLWPPLSWLPRAPQCVMKECFSSLMNARALALRAASTTSSGTTSALLPWPSVEPVTEASIGTCASCYKNTMREGGEVPRARALVCCLQAGRTLCCT